MSTTKSSTINTNFARQLARRMDVQGVVEYADRPDRPSMVTSVIRTLWCAALSRGTPELLSELRGMSDQMGNPWVVPDPQFMVKHALLGTNPNNVSWSLLQATHRPNEEEIVRLAVTTALIAIGEQKEPSGPLATLIAPVVERYPTLLAGVKPDDVSFSVSMACLDLLGSQLPVTDLAPVLEFFNQLPRSKKLPQPQSVVSNWWSRLALHSTSEVVVPLAIALDETPSLYPLARQTFPCHTSSGPAHDLWTAALISRGPALEDLLSAAPDTSVFRAVSNRLSPEVTALLVGGLATYQPARLARLFSKSALLTERALAYRSPLNENILHVLATSRIRPDLAAPQELRWSRLEAWAMRHTLDMATQASQDGTTPLSLMAPYPTWASHFRKVLLSRPSSLRPSEPRSMRSKL